MPHLPGKRISDSSVDQSFAEGWGLVLFGRLRLGCAALCVKNELRR